MKQMRVLNCTNRQREAIFAIADEVGCPVGDLTRAESFHGVRVFPNVIFSGFQIVSVNESDIMPILSFSEFITELLKYKKPKVWVTKEIVPLTSYDVGPSDSPIAWCYIPKNSRNHKFTYEIQEEQK